ncbi:LuxR C-terminal-related transcriptional regulator [Salipaludibacillus sp. CF4.18]|uniref:LuxR C-terminal-related transcriptional regulator n=1 Tax=Salipaludibacillus sp. CF4.18 TaxID=3373081 RepID=UPI003EE6349D
MNNVKTVKKHLKVILFDSQKILTEEKIFQHNKDLIDVTIMYTTNKLDCEEPYDYLLYLVEDCTYFHDENLAYFKEELQGKKKIIIVTKTKVREEFVSLLALPVYGMISYEFLLQNENNVIELLRNERLLVDPAIQKKLAFEIDRKKQSKTPLKSFVLNREKVAHILKVNEQNVLQLLLDGKSTKQIATELHFSPSTISTIICKLLKNLGVNDRTEAVVYAIRNEWAVGER